MQSKSVSNYPEYWFVPTRQGFEDGRIVDISVQQTAPAAWPTQRTHRTQLGLYDIDAGKSPSGACP